MYKTIIIMMAMLLAGCQSGSQTAVTVAGSADSDALVSAGKVIGSYAEVGITGVGFDGPEKTDYAAGPYAVYLVPLPEDIGKDWQPFTGGAMLFDEDFEAIPKIIAGFIYKPSDRISPVYFAEKAFPTGSVDSVNIANREDDVYHWLGLRCRF